MGEPGPPAGVGVEVEGGNSPGGPAIAKEHRPGGPPTKEAGQELAVRQGRASYQVTPTDTGPAAKVMEMLVAAMFALIDWRAACSLLIQWLSHPTTRGSCCG